MYPLGLRLSPSKPLGQVPLLVVDIATGLGYLLLLLHLVALGQKTSWHLWKEKGKKKNLRLLIKRWPSICGKRRETAKKSLSFCPFLPHFIHFHLTFIKNCHVPVEKTKENGQKKLFIFWEPVLGKWRFHFPPYLAFFPPNDKIYWVFAAVKGNTYVYCFNFT